MDAPQAGIRGCQMDLEETIAALASAPGRGARGIIRVSGGDVQCALARWFRPADPTAWQSPRGAWRHPGYWQLPEGRSQLPLDLYLWPTARSYTGQPMAELHLPGSPPLLEMVLAQLFASGVRPARPGEFTLRAFLAGRVDLTQAEAVLGVVDADTPGQLHRALAQLAGGVAGKVDRLRSDLLDLLADLEAGLDFTDEGIEFVSQQELVRRLREARQVVELLLAQATTRMRSAARARIVLAGAPNAGKSTLFNRLAGKELALVSDIRGTTRDYLKVELEWNGLPVELIDTAGWEQDATGIMREALSLRSEQMQQASLVLWCQAADEISADQPHEELYSAFSGTGAQIPLLQVLTKADLASPSSTDSDGVLAVSAHTGAGLEELRHEVVRRLADAAGEAGELVGSTAARCRDSLQSALDALDRALEAADAGSGDEFLAMDVREALDELGQITGAVYTDDILDRIFSRFCIGK